MANEEKAKTQDIKLDDTRRVRVLSPGMLVAKRFFRNRLAIIGMVIIIFMFLFSFLGGAIIPYGQSQVFYRTEEMKKDYAGATYISDYMLFENKEAELPSDLYSKSILGISTGKNVAETRNGGKIALRPLEGDSYIVYHAEETKNPRAIRSQEHDAAVGASDNYFEYDGVPYIVDSSTGKELLYMVSELGVVCKLSFTPYAQSTVLPFDFYKNVLVAMSQGDKKFEAQGNTYTLEQGGEESAMVLAEDGSDYVYITNMNMNSVIGGVFLSPEFKEAAALAIKEGAESFEYTSQPGEASLPETEGEGAAFLRAAMPFLDEDADMRADVDMAAKIIEDRALKTRQFFNTIAEHWDTLSREVLGGFALAGAVCAVMPEGCEAAVDLGCGTGLVLERMRGRARQIIGVDGSPRMLELSRRRLAGAEEEGISLRIGELSHLPLRDGEADFASINMVLHHLSNPESALAEIRRVLRPGGLLMVADFDRHNQERMRLDYGDLWLGFDEATMTRLLQAAGFEIVSYTRRPVEQELALNLTLARRL